MMRRDTIRRGSHEPLVSIPRPSMAHEYNGACHCGQVAFQVLSEFGFDELPIRTCSCTYCLKLNSVYCADANGSLIVTLRAPGITSGYQFGHKTATWFRCNNCGITPFVLSKIDNHTYGLANITCLDGRPDLGKDYTRHDFDNEEEAGRLDRRQQSWFGDVRWAAGSAVPEGWSATT